MHREGHIGIGLLLYSPFSFLLLEADAQTAWGLGLVAVCFWSFAPDIDLNLPIPHRGPTHTIWSAIAAGLMTALVMLTLLLLGILTIPSLLLGIVGVVLAFLLGVVGVLGHLLGDAITPMKITPFKPYSSRKVGINLVRAKNPTANESLAVAGAVVLTGSIVVAVV